MLTSKMALGYQFLQRLPVPPRQTASLFAQARDSQIRIIPLILDLEDIKRFLASGKYGLLLLVSLGHLKCKGCQKQRRLQKLFPRGIPSFFSMGKKKSELLQQDSLYASASSYPSASTLFDKSSVAHSPSLFTLPSSNTPQASPQPPRIYSPSASASSSPIKQQQQSSSPCAPRSRTLSLGDSPSASSSPLIPFSSSSTKHSLNPLSPMASQSPPKELQDSPSSCCFPSFSSTQPIKLPLQQPHCINDCCPSFWSCCSCSEKRPSHQGYTRLNSKSSHSSYTTNPLSSPLLPSYPDESPSGDDEDDFQGHYIFLVGYDRASDMIYYRDPGLPSPLCWTKAGDLDVARRVNGTDHDCIVVKVR